MTPFSNNRHLVAVGLLAAAWGIFHFLFLSREQAALTASETAFRTKRVEVGALATMKTAQDDLLRFRTLLPKETDLPKLVALLSEMSEAHGLVIPSTSYAKKKSDLPDIASVTITFDLSGTYPEIVAFIDAIERATPFFVIEHLTLASSKGEEDGETVKLQIQIAAYTRHDIASKAAPVALTAGGARAGGVSPQGRAGKQTS